jgi:hypothetical protein
MCAMLFGLFGSLPRVELRDEAVAAGRCWVSLLLVSVCLGVAIIVGMLSFVLAAAYPEQWLWADVGGVGVVAGALVLLVIAYWLLAFYRTFPGLKSVRKGEWSMVCFWNAADLKDLVPGTDEIKKELSALKARLASTDASVSAIKDELIRLRGSSDKLVECMRESNRLLESIDIKAGGGGKK